MELATGSRSAFTALPQGANVLATGGVHYRVWAPEAQRVEVEVQSSPHLLRRLALTREEHGYHSGRDAQGRAGDRYRFRLDGAQTLPDPAARWQPEGVHGPSMVIDPRVFRWQVEDFARPAFRDLVIYELHVGTFTPGGTFRSAIERLPHLQALGVNAVELMPVADFAGRRNWGYDGVALYAPARVYGHPDELRAFVDTAHSLGLAVILDVVYNHFGPDGNYLASYIGDYLDEAEKTPWGGAIRYGSPAFRGLRELVVSNVRYWMDEFRVDGFRFDATHAIVDDSPRPLLAELSELVHARGGYAVAEDSRNEAQLMAPVASGGLGLDAVWADDFHHIVRVAGTREAEAYLADFAGTLEELVTTLRDGWLYSGQHSAFSGRPRGTSPAALPPGACIHCISNHDQVGNRALGERLSHSISPAAYRAASMLLCLTPHTPLLFMGQEWAASTPFRFFTDHHEDLGRLITAGRRDEFRSFAAFQGEAGLSLVPDPQAEATFRASLLHWDELAAAPHAGVLALYRASLALRRSEAAFRPTHRHGYHVEGTPWGICALRLPSAEGEWLLLVDLVGGHCGEFPELAHGEWTRVLSSREKRFGGDGSSARPGDDALVNFTEPEALLLRRAASPRAE